MMFPRERAATLSRVRLNDLLGFAHFIKSVLTRRENILQHRIRQIQFRRLRTVAHSARSSPLVGESE